MICGNTRLTSKGKSKCKTVVGVPKETKNDNQKKKWLPKLSSAEWIGAWGLTEHNTGSDAGGMSTTAVKDGDEWVLNGSKNFITHAISGDIAVVIARTGKKGDSHAMTAFVIEKVRSDRESNIEREQYLDYDEAACIQLSMDCAKGIHWSKHCFLPSATSPIFL